MVAETQPKTWGPQHYTGSVTHVSGRYSLTSHLQPHSNFKSVSMARRYCSSRCGAKSIMWLWRYAYPPRDGGPEGGVAEKLKCDTAGFFAHRARMDVKQLALQWYGPQLSFMLLWGEIQSVVGEIREELLWICGSCQWEGAVSSVGKFD